MLWRWAGWTVAAALLVVAGAVLLVLVDVPGATRSGSCGSGWDVVSGRVGWPQWWSQDLADPIGRGDGGLVRTVRCPGAVNDRIVTSGVLAVAAVVVAAVGELVQRRRSPRAPAPRAYRRLRALGTTLTVLGGLLTAAGLVAIALITADPHAPLFLYVSRAAAVLAGLLLVLPAIVLTALGRGLRLWADAVAEGMPTDDQE